MNPHNRVGITEYIIQYINKSISLTWPLGRIQMPRRASSLNIAAESKVASVACVVPLPYKRLTGRRILVRTGIVEARDKAVSTFWNCTCKPPKRETSCMLFGCSKGSWFEASAHFYYSFSCRYSMSYDISISLLKKNFCKESLVKVLGKGELIFKRGAGGQSNMTTIFIKSGQSHMTTSIPSAVPCKYSEP
jgi:hypothetical protein